MRTVTLTTVSPEQTAALGAALGSMCAAGDVVCLHGYVRVGACVCVRECVVAGMCGCVWVCVGVGVGELGGGACQSCVCQ